MDKEVVEGRQGWWSGTRHLNNIFIWACRYSLKNEEGGQGADCFIILLYLEEPGQEYCQEMGLTFRLACLQHLQHSLVEDLMDKY